MRSFLSIIVLITALIGQSMGRSADKRALSSQQKSTFLRFVQSFLRHKHLHARQDEQCVLDDYYTFLNTYSSATEFCSNYISVPLATVTVDSTPVVTQTVIISTTTILATEVVRSTPHITTTVFATTTVAPMVKRMETTPAPALRKRDAPFMDFVKRQASTSSTNVGANTASGMASISSAFSSACSCLEIVPSSTTVTYTDAASTFTEDARLDVHLTSTSLTVFPTQVVTVTDLVTVNGTQIMGTSTASSTSSISTSSSTSSQPGSTVVVISTPGMPTSSTSSTTTTSNSSVVTSQSLTSTIWGTSNTSTTSIATTDSTASSLTTSTIPPASTAPTSTISTVGTPSSVALCPADDGKNITQIIDGRSLVYTIYCDNFLEDTSLAEGSFDTFEDCIEACTYADDGAEDSACQGVVFYPSLIGSMDCYLKVSADMRAPLTGANAAVLREVEFDNQGTTSTATLSPSAVSTTVSPTTTPPVSTTSVSSTGTGSNSSIPGTTSTLFSNATTSTQTNSTITSTYLTSTATSTLFNSTVTSTLFNISTATNTSSGSGSPTTSAPYTNSTTSATAGSTSSGYSYSNTTMPTQSVMTNASSTCPLMTVTLNTCSAVTLPAVTLPAVTLPPVTVTEIMSWGPV